MIEIREARPADADAIATAHVEGWRAGYRGVVDDEFLDDPEFLRIRRENWTRRLQHGPPSTSDISNVVYALLVDRAVIGFGHFGREEQPPPDTPERGEIYGFYVHPEHWGTGASNELMDECLLALRSRFSSAVLWTLRDNPRSRGFYERHGWRCGTGDEIIIDTWEGPVISGLPPLSSPLHNIQYRLDLA